MMNLLLDVVEDEVMFLDGCEKAEGFRRLGLVFLFEGLLSRGVDGLGERLCVCFG